MTESDEKVCEIVVTDMRTSCISLSHAHPMTHTLTHIDVVVNEVHHAHLGRGDTRLVRKEVERGLV